MRVIRLDSVKTYIVIVFFALCITCFGKDVFARDATGSEDASGDASEEIILEEPSTHWNTVLLIGDSYARGTSADDDVGAANSWSGLLTKTLHAQNILTYARGGAGMSAALNSDHTNFQTLLNRAYYSFPDVSGVDLIVLIGGYNDIGIAYNTVNQAVVTWVETANTYFPNAKIVIGVGEHTVDTEKEAMLNAVILDAYYRAAEKTGVYYINGIEHVLADEDMSSDGYHPNLAGQRKLAAYMLPFIDSLPQTPSYDALAALAYPDGIQNISGNLFYVSEGRVDWTKSGQHNIDGSWYYFDETSHAALTGLKTIASQNKTVYYDGTGKMVKGQKKIGSSWYYFDETTGAMTKGLKYLSAQKKWVYYDTNGKMVKGQKKIGSSWYYFDETTGAMVKGFKYLSAQKKWVYYDANGRMVKGQKKIGSSWYYFDETTGAMVKGFKYLTAQKKWVYYDTNGRMVKGWYKAGNNWYYFNTVTGAWERTYSYA